MFNGTHQSQCDMQHPQEMMLWALNSPIPEFNSDGFPVFDEQTARMISVHLYQCGFRYMPGEQNRLQSVADDGSIVWTDNKPLNPENHKKNIENVVKAAKQQGNDELLNILAGKLAGLAKDIIAELDKN